LFIMLDSFFKRLDAQAVTFTTQIPPKTEVYRVADGLFQFLFPIMNDDPKPARVQYPALRHELISLLLPVLGGQADRAMEMADAFFEQLPHVYDLLQDDAEAFLRFDPAATCLEEVIVTIRVFMR
jgi:serine O-acetyltransferase